MKRTLKKRFELYSDSDEIISLIQDDYIYLRYFKNNNDILSLSTRLDIEITKDICYLLDIELCNNERGKGYGWQLYSVAHEFAYRLGLSCIIQAPSGITYNNETRETYLKKRGYQKLNSSELILRL